MALGTANRSEGGALFSLALLVPTFVCLVDVVDRDVVRLSAHLQSCSVTLCYLLLHAGRMEGR